MLISSFLRRQEPSDFWPNERRYFAIERHQARAFAGATRVLKIIVLGAGLISVASACASSDVVDATLAVSSVKIRNSFRWKRLLSEAPWRKNKVTDFTRFIDTSPSKTTLSRKS